MGNCLCCCIRDNLDSQISSIYDITMKDINKQVVSFNDYRNRVLLIVNVACK